MKHFSSIPALIASLVALPAAALAEPARLQPGESVLVSPEHLALMVRSNQLVAQDHDGTVTMTCYCGPQIPLSDVPLHVRQALIAIEDRRFLLHNGVDPYGIGRGVLKSIFGSLQGGSTITQQLCKIKVLSSVRSYFRKGLDATCAFSLETLLSKDEILEAYFNGMVFGYWRGRPIIGIEQAARFHFGKQANDLSPREGALLVAMFKSPTRYNPTTQPEAAASRAATILEAMAEEGYITRAQLRKYLTSTVRRGKLKPLEFEHRYFTDWVKRDLSRLEVNLPVGSRIILTFEATTQSLAEKSFRASLSDLGLSPTTPARFVTMKLDGRVAAMMGNWRYDVDQSNGVAGDLRQPASAFKPFIYAAALENGWKPSSKLLDGPKPGESWSVKMLDRAMGRITMSDALAYSANIATVRLLRSVGGKRVIAIARRLGITSHLRDDSALALGASEVSLLQLTAGFVPFANGGFAVTPRGYHGVTDANGNVIHWARNDRSVVLSPTTAKTMKAMLQRVVHEGTGRGAAKIKGAGGKTGTSDNNRDAWFIGFTRGQVTGVWAGVPAGETRKLPLAGHNLAGVWAKIVLAFRGK
jgi:penicillin-binding protein 1A